MAKLRRVDMNIDVSGIDDRFLIKDAPKEKRDAHQKALAEWAKKPEKERGDKPELEIQYMSGKEFVKHIAMQAISQVHKTGNAASLRRTKSIGEMLSLGLIDDGFIVLGDEDFKYIKSAMSKADNWNNNEMTAAAILLVDDAIQGAEEVEA